MQHKLEIITYVKQEHHHRDYDYHFSKYLHLSTHYWTTTIFKILNFTDQEILSETTQFLRSCKNKDGGYGSTVGYPSTVFNTMMACQIATMLGLHFYDEKTVDYLLGCCRDGVFHAETITDELIEEDSRFCCAALISLALLDADRTKGENSFAPVLSEELLARLSLKGLEKENVIVYLLRCYNTDGGFGCIPGAESHCGQIYACLLSLKLLDALHRIDRVRTAFFLISRQQESGGLNGRPYKKEDACYSFWTLASLDILDSVKYIDAERLREFINSCYSEKRGGFSDRPGNVCDCFHTMYALLGLSLLEGGRCSNDILHLGIYLN